MDVWGRNSPDTWVSRVETLRCSVPARFGELRKAAVTGDKIKKGKGAGNKEEAAGLPHHEWPYRPWKGT